MKNIKTEITLEQIYSPIEAYLPLVEQKILEILESPNELSKEVISYFFKNKGKFLRPALCLFGASFNGGISEHVIITAAALEIFHSATLIHDDIIDSACLRRSVPTIHVAWDPQVAVLIGDFLHDRAVNAIFGLRNARVISLLLETAGIVCDGEMLEVSQKNNFLLKEDQYHLIIEKKTASLLSACLQIGAVLAGLPEAQIAALKRYGLYFGMAFQMIDDYLDFTGVEHEFGKTLGADFTIGVFTLPLIRLIANSDEKTKNEVIRLVRLPASESRFTELMRYLESCDALTYTYDKAKERADLARNELLALEPCEAKRSLDLLLTHILERNR